MTEPTRPMTNEYEDGMMEPSIPAPTMAQHIRSFLIPFVTLCIVLGTAVAIIAYGRGYRLNTNGSLKSTGLVVVSSEPSGAQIFVDNKIKTATQATLTMPPGWYTITVTKDGFQPWSKHIKIQGEVVAKAEALLLPTNPSLTALTASGVLSPTLSPDGSKLAYVIPDIAPTASTAAILATTKPGVWVLDLVDKPLGLNRDARQIAKSNTIDFSKATLAWSPDSKQILATIPTAAYTLDVESSNDIPLPVTNIKVLQTDWQTIKDQRSKEQFLTVPKQFTAVASASAQLIAFSPDETRILYQATASAILPPIVTPPVIGANPTEEMRTLTPGNIYVYDIKEDRNYFITKQSALVPASAPQKNRAPVVEDISYYLHWLPSSRHLLLVTKDKIEIMDYDATNRRTAYAGPFWDTFAVPWASGGKIVILTNLNSAASADNNLYVVNLR